MHTAKKKSWTYGDNCDYQCPQTLLPLRLDVLKIFN